MYRPHFQVSTSQIQGTPFKKEDVLDPIKAFLDRHSVPSEIVKNVRFSGNNIYVSLEEGSITKHGAAMKSAFNPLSTAKYSYALQDNDVLYFWVPFLEDVVEANNKHNSSLAAGV